MESVSNSVLKMRREVWFLVNASMSILGTNKEYAIGQYNAGMVSSKDRNNVMMEIK